MRFKIDKNLPVEFCELLRSDNHDAVTVLQQGLGGSSDSDLIEICRAEGRALLSLDVDFSDIRRYPPAQPFGIIVFRTHPQDKDHLLECLSRIIPILKTEGLQHRLWIVEPDRVRIRE